MMRMSLFDKVAAREVSPSKAAEMIMAERVQRPSKPAWMPYFLYAVGMVFLSAILPAIVDRRS